MHVIVLANQKGGVGKTTLGLHLAVAAQADLGPVAMIDMDPQNTLLRWWHTRTSEAPAMAEASIAELGPKLRELDAAGYRLVVIDTPGRESFANKAVIEYATFVLIPVKPSPADLWATAPTVTACKQLGQPYAFVVSQATRGASATIEAVSVLSEFGQVAPSVIHNRVGYGAALGEGRTLQEVDPRNPGAGEIAKLLDFIKTRLHATTQSSAMGSKAYA